MLNRTGLAVVTALVLGAGVSSACLAESPEAARQDAQAQQVAELSADHPFWDEMFSRDPYPAMGVGSTHRAKMKAAPLPVPDRRAWDQMFSRDPYPGMGVGSAHGALTAR